MTTSYWQDEADPVASKTVSGRDSWDHVIIGAGITGCSTAYWLSRNRPDESVLILEATAVAHGASGRNAGFLLQAPTTDYENDVKSMGLERARLLWRFSEQNVQLLRETSFADKVGMRFNGSLTLSGDDAEWAALQGSQAALSRDGFNVQLVTPDKIHQFGRMEGFKGGLHWPEDGEVHPFRLCQYLAKTSGADRILGSRVLEIRQGRLGPEAVTEDGRYPGTRLYVCTNGYSSVTGLAAGTHVHPVRAQMTQLTTTDMPALACPVYSHRGFYYMRSTEDGLLLGGARHLFRDDEVGLNDRTTDDLQAALVAYARKHLSLGSEVRQVRAWSGVMGFTEDHIPMVGPVAEYPEVFVAAGFNGHGMGYAYHVGRMLSRWGDPEDAAYRKLFDPSRFSA